MQTGLKSWSFEKYHLLKTELWFSVFSHGLPISLAFSSSPFSLPFSPLCSNWEKYGFSRSRLLLFHISLFVFISLTTYQIVHFTMDGTRGKKNIIFIIKSVLLHERTIKWPINFSLFLSQLSTYSFYALALCSLPIFLSLCKVNDDDDNTKKKCFVLSIGKWKIYGHD